MVGYFRYAGKQHPIGAMHSRANVGKRFGGCPLEPKGETIRSVWRRMFAWCSCHGVGLFHRLSKPLLACRRGKCARDSAVLSPEKHDYCCLYIARIPPKRALIHPRLPTSLGWDHQPAFLGLVWIASVSKYEQWHCRTWEDGNGLDSVKRVIEPRDFGTPLLVSSAIRTERPAKAGRLEGDSGKR